MCTITSPAIHIDRLSKNDNRRVREKTSSFLLQHDVLYHKGHKGKQQRVIKRNKVATLVSSMHMPLVGGCHFGVNATHQKMAERYWWPTTTEDIHHCVRTCER